MDKKPNSKNEATSRVDTVHGGELVEAIAQSSVVSVNDANCKHDMMHRDLTETDFIAFVCDNPNCGIVKLYDKQERK